MDKEIIYIHPFTFPSKKANTVQVVKMCNNFSKEGYKIHLYCFGKYFESKNKIYNFYGVKKNFNIYTFPQIIFLPTKILKYLLILYCFVKIFFLKNKDICIYSRDIKISYFFTMIGLKNILEMHSPPINIRDKLLLKRIYYKKSFKKLVLISNNLKNYYINFINSSKTIIQHDGIDFAKKVKNKKLFKGINPKICYVGSLHKGKGLELIIKLAKSNKNLLFNVYGGEDAQINKLKNSYKNLVFHGHIQHKNVSDILFKHDIALMPYMSKVSSVGHKDISKWMSPLKMFEYMSHKMVIISSSHNVLKEVLNKSNSYIINSFNANEWTKCLHKICNNKKKAKKKAEIAFKDSLQYTWSKRVKKIMNEER